MGVTTIVARPLFCQHSSLLSSHPYLFRMREISNDKLRQAGKYLDEKPPALSAKPCKEEYWRQLIDVLPYRVYTNVQIETFAEELFGPTGSPGLRLLVDLQERGLEYEAFLEALETIKCYKALNLFVQSSKS